MGAIARRFMGVRTAHFPTVTLAGLTCNLSLVDGTAFITNPSVDLTPYVGCKITLVDTSGYKVVGWIKAKGSSESLDSNLVTNGNFTTDTAGWLKAPPETSIASIAGGESGNCLELTAAAGASQAVYRGVSLVSGVLYKASAYSKSGTSGNESARWNITQAPHYADVLVNTTASWQEMLRYFTSSGTGSYDTNLRKNSATNGTMLFDTHVIQQVLTPSATGVTITSSLDGATYNWFAKHSGFLPNSASFTAIIEG